MDFFLWLVFTSNLNSQTTWLKVKLKLVNFDVRHHRRLLGWRDQPHTSQPNNQASD